MAAKCPKPALRDHPDCRARAVRKANIRLYPSDRGLMYSTFFPEAVAARIIRVETLGESAPAVGDTSGLAPPFLGDIAWSSERRSRPCLQTLVMHRSRYYLRRCTRSSRSFVRTRPMPRQAAACLTLSPTG